VRDTLSNVSAHLPIHQWAGWPNLAGLRS
jgi:hypothetical protein